MTASSGDIGGTAGAGYWPSPWPGEDGGPRRLQQGPAGTRSPFATGEVEVRSRDAIAATMVVLREIDEVFLLRHTAGPQAVSWVEQIDPLTLDEVARSVELAGGPTWPGGLAAHANGSIYVVFGRHAHRLAPDLTVTASRELPRHRPYNSFVILPDGHLVTKDFGGVLPGQAPDEHRAEPTELVVLEPDHLTIVARATLAEPSIARLSADGDDIYVVGTSSLLRVRWTGAVLDVDEEHGAPYRTIPGQTYGWDPVIALGAAWFLDDGEGSERYAGTMRGQGVSTAPLHLVRVDLGSGAVTLTEICGRPGGLVANPPLVDETRRIVVGYDSGNGVLAAFDVDDEGATTPRWTRDQDHGCHQLLIAGTGDLVTDDHDPDRMADQLVVLDIETGEERVRVDTGSAIQSVLFPALGWHDDLYYCSFSTVARIAAVR